MAEARIGISGWRYAPWRGKFYPDGLRQKDELAYALDRWAGRIGDWTAGREADGQHAGPPARRQARDVYVYFDNDAKVRAPFDALNLIRRLS